MKDGLDNIRMSLRIGNEIPIVLIDGNISPKLEPAHKKIGRRKRHMYPSVMIGRGWLAENLSEEEFIEFSVARLQGSL